ncbi:tetratricopeptide repeat protein [Chondrinema litorale]|uniref:tetratricopeptide repeat protein n=1 Tax=Chondrinema litorale TaxID=2994555 RepID=UPI00254353C9|nr:tetratricopeptide repeat protein [Chondrinema litorale]UZS00207.1 tetratricopeptide repeat protein [Chondrinema litorale]
MENIERNIYLIERKYDNSLTPNEQSEFENKLKSDKNFQSLFKNENLMVGGIIYKKRLELLDKIKHIEANYQKESQNNNIFNLKPGNKKFWSVAAVITIIISVTSLLLDFSKSNNSDLFDTYYYTYENIYRVRSNNEYSKIDQAFEAYDKGNFLDASNLFEEILGTDVDYAIIFYIANTQLEMGVYEKAITNYSKVIANDARWGIPAEWYLALTYLKINNIEEAISTFESIKKSNNSYSSKASEIITKLE